MKKGDSLNIDMILTLEGGEQIHLENKEGYIVGLEKIFCLDNEYIAVALFGADIGKLYNFNYIKISDILEDLKDEFGVIDLSIIE